MRAWFLLLVLAAPAAHAAWEPLELTVPYADPAAVSAAGSFLLFGGDMSNQSYLVLPEHGAVAEYAARMPDARAGARAIWDGQLVHLFGGRDANGTEHASAWSFDPARGWWSVTPVDDPGGPGATPLRVGNEIWMFGGSCDAPCALRKYVPGDRFEPLPIQLPMRVEYAAALWTGSEVHLLGGLHDGVPSAAAVIVTKSGQVSIHANALPAPLARAHVTYDGLNAYLAGPETVWEYRVHERAARPLLPALPSPGGQLVAHDGGLYLVGTDEGDRRGMWMFTPRNATAPHANAWCRVATIDPCNVPVIERGPPTFPILGALVLVTYTAAWGWSLRPLIREPRLPRGVQVPRAIAAAAAALVALSNGMAWATYRIADQTFEGTPFALNGTAWSLIELPGRWFVFGAGSAHLLAAALAITAMGIAANRRPFATGLAIGATAAGCLFWLATAFSLYLLAGGAILEWSVGLSLAALGWVIYGLGAFFTFRRPGEPEDVDAPAPDAGSAEVGDAMASPGAADVPFDDPESVS